MAVKLNGATHSTRVNLETTLCGLAYDPAAKYKGSDITCPDCSAMSHRDFMSGWEAWEKKNPAAVAAMDDEARRAELTD